MKETYMTRMDEGLGEGLFDSIKWVHEEHMKQPDTGDFHYALAYGDEGSPEKVEFWIDEPNYDTPPDRVWMTDKAVIQLALDSFRAMYARMQNGESSEDLLEDASLWPLTRLREALEE